MGSGYSDQARHLAEGIGRELASRKHVLLYGPERNCPSLPYFAAAAAKKADGFTLAVAIGSARTPFYDSSAASLTVYTDASGGAGREVVLVNSADAVIAIGGGSGTLTEMSIAYMNFLPIVAVNGSGGWSENLIGRYLDERKKFKIAGASSPKETLDLAEELAAKFASMPSQYEKQSTSFHKPEHLLSK